MPGKSTFLENELLDHLLGNAAYTSPATVWIALYTATPSDDGGGTEVVSTGGYTRAAVLNNATNWPAASLGAKFNAVAVSFPEATASWGTVSGFAILDASAAGNILYFGTLSTAKAIEIGDSATFASGDIDISEE